MLDGFSAQTLHRTVSLKGQSLHPAVAKWIYCFSALTVATHRLYPFFKVETVPVVFRI